MSLPKINHIVEDMEELSGGVPAVVRQLTKRLALEGHNVTVTYCLGDASDLNDIAKTRRYRPQGLLRNWSHSKALGSAFSNLTSQDSYECLIHHIHGVQGTI